MCLPQKQAGGPVQFFGIACSHKASRIFWQPPPLIPRNASKIRDSCYPVGVPVDHSQRGPEDPKHVPLNRDSKRFHRLRLAGAFDAPLAI